MTELETSMEVRTFDCETLVARGPVPKIALPAKFGFHTLLHIDVLDADVIHQQRNGTVNLICGAQDFNQSRVDINVGAQGLHELRSRATGVVPALRDEDYDGVACADTALRSHEAAYLSDKRVLGEQFQASLEAVADLVSTSALLNPNNAGKSTRHRRKRIAAYCNEEVVVHVGYDALVRKFVQGSKRINVRMSGELHEKLLVARLGTQLAS